MASTGSADSISDQAVEWAVLAEYGEMTSELRTGLDAWLAADARHGGAYLRARAALYLAEDAVVGFAQPAVQVSQSVNDNDDESAPPLYRRLAAGRWWSLSGAAALAVATLALGVVAVSRSPTPMSTASASSAHAIKLRDGSIATLNKDAKIDVAFSPDHRRITLVSGEAVFNVAKDRARPFVVQSGDIYAQATGTVYSVRRVGASGGRVRVAKGSVLVWTRDERDQAVLLHAGGELTLQPGPSRPAPRLPEAGDSVSPLPQGEAQISLNGVPIKQAVARFNRVNSTKIVIDDPSIGGIEIVGLFKANEPETFARAAAAIGGGIVAHDAGNIVIKNK